MNEEIERLRAALEPFARLFPSIMNEWNIGPGDCIQVNHPVYHDRKLIFWYDAFKKAADAMKEA